MEYVRISLFFLGLGLLFYFLYLAPVNKIREKYFGDKKKEIDRIAFRQNWSFYLRDSSFNSLNKNFTELEIVEIKKIMQKRKKNLLFATVIYLFLFSQII